MSNGPYFRSTFFYDANSIGNTGAFDLNELSIAVKSVYAPSRSDIPCTLMVRFVDGTLPATGTAG